MQTNVAAAFFPLRVGDGTVFIGPAAELDAATASWPQSHRDFSRDLESALRANADIGRLRAAFVQWGVPGSTHAISDRQLFIEVAELVRRGRLAARFLPRFVDDPRGPAGGAEPPFRHYQLDGAYPQAKTGLISTPSESTPRMLGPRPPPETAETDFPDEPTQALVLRKAAQDGVPFCEICAKAAKAKAA
jgi:hypothetical protein